jgi:hypothetical protein
MSASLGKKIIQSRAFKFGLTVWAHFVGESTTDRPLSSALLIKERDKVSFTPSAFIILRFFVALGEEFNSWERFDAVFFR